MSRHIVVGLTGQTGAGKTTVSDMIKYQGVPVIDCDYISRVVTQKDCPCTKELVSAFSDVILNQDKTLNRKALGKIAFSNKQKLELLNSITHPYIMKEIHRQIEKSFKKGYNIVVLDAPTLFESGADSICDHIITVFADEHIRLERILKRDEIEESYAKERMKAQPDIDFYKERSDYMIYNNGDINELKRQTLEILDTIESMIALGV